MGMTIHYCLQSKVRLAHKARQIVDRLHEYASKLQFKELGPVVEFTGSACDYQNCQADDPHHWMLIQASTSVEVVTQGHRGKHRTTVSVAPDHMVAFRAWPGAGCEQANIGLCHYPQFVEVEDDSTWPTRKVRYRTGLTGWRWASFCKTQYASDPRCGGVENFIRCHLSVLALLEHAKSLGVLAEVSDEGGFWEGRDIKVLVEEVGEWNGMIAAFAGQLKDQYGEGIQAPIFQFSNFEHLEARGAERLPPGEP